MAKKKKVKSYRTAPQKSYKTRGETWKAPKMQKYSVAKKRAGYGNWSRASFLQQQNEAALAAKDASMTANAATEQKMAVDLAQQSRDRLENMRKLQSQHAVSNAAAGMAAATTMGDQQELNDTLNSAFTDVVTGRNTIAAEYAQALRENAVTATEKDLEVRQKVTDFMRDTYGIDATLKSEGRETVSNYKKKKKKTTKKKKASPKKKSSGTKKSSSKKNKGKKATPLGPHTYRKPHKKKTYKKFKVVKDKKGNKIRQGWDGKNWQNVK